MVAPEFFDIILGSKFWKVILLVGAAGRKKIAAKKEWMHHAMIGPEVMDTNVELTHHGIVEQSA